ncbi:MAG: glycosyltransferase family 2 protein, partial [Acidimicrobiales bacterium]|nr:glycosyltransferase family 2 protein [Acidimicrobiales bacterium]
MTTIQPLGGLAGDIERRWSTLVARAEKALTAAKSSGVRAAVEAVTVPADTLSVAPWRGPSWLPLSPPPTGEQRRVAAGVPLVRLAVTTEPQASVEELEQGIDDLVERVDWSGVCWRKGSEASRPAPEIPAAVDRPAHAPLAAPEVPSGARRDLSVVVVFYNMKREAARTLHSLSRSYQQGLDDATYEVIVVENGSDPDQVLGEDYVRSFGPEFRYLDLGDDAQPSPAHALNRGMALAGGDAICFMIDGAHVLTPGVLRYGLQGLRTYAPTVVATQLWYVGPGQQGDAMLEGYDQDYEDRLFDEIAWPGDGYRLFDIGHFVGDRDWLDGLWESN